MALKPLTCGETITCDGESVTLLEDIPQGHKVALKDISKDSPILKYGLPIGKATADIKKGQWIHTQNLKHSLATC